MEIPEAIRQRLEALGLEQRQLAQAADVTESYISQLLTGKKPPPEPARTDIYSKMEELLELPQGALARVADLQRREQLKMRLGPPAPLYSGVRELVLRKCSPDKANEVRQYFEQQPFGELERLVTQKLLELVKDVASEELDSEGWLRSVAQLGDRSYEEMRVVILQFLDANVRDLSIENCVSFLEPLVESWDIDLETFRLDITLNRRLIPHASRRFEFNELKSKEASDKQPGLKEFMADAALSGDTTEEEIGFLKGLEFNGRRPNSLYYYRELQSLRDPLHFREGSGTPGD